MKPKHSPALMTGAMAAFIVAAALFPTGWTGGGLMTLQARGRTAPVDPNDVTFRLFQLLDDTHDGKLSDFCIIADTFKDKDSAKPDEELQHVLLIDYNKNLNFGKLNIHVRTLSKLAPDQLKTYSPKAIYGFGGDDSEKFLKSGPGPFGQSGDLYLRATADRPLSSTPITDEARKAYDFYLTQYVLPALQKK
jgi:hypothetical protein